MLFTNGSEIYLCFFADFALHGWLTGAFVTDDGRCGGHFFLVELTGRLIKNCSKSE